MSSRPGRCLAVLLTAAAALFAVPAAWGAESGTGAGEFSFPRDVATDLAGNVYVAEGSFSDHHQRIQKLTPNGAFIGRWGSRGEGNGELLSSRGIATDAAANVYVTDNYTRYIQKFTSGGTFITKWAGRNEGANWLPTPQGIATDAAANVYVIASYDIQKFTSDGVFIAEWGGRGEGVGKFQTPNAIATDATGDVYVVDSLAERVQKFTSSGIFITQWETIGIANGVATDPAGNVYVAGNVEIQKFTSNGALITKWGSLGKGNGQFDFAMGIATDPAGNVYVADTVNHRIQKFTSDGVFLAAWGKGEKSKAAPARPRITAGPNGKTAKRSATFSFVSSQPGVRFQCRLSGDRAPKALTRWSACTSPHRYTNLKTGKKTFSVRAAMGGKAGPPARRSWTIVAGKKRSGPAPLIIPTTARKVIFRAVCPQPRRCRAQVTIRAGRRTLARGRYSVPARSSRKVRLTLTKVGRQKLARQRSTRAKATIRDTRSGKSRSLPVILRRR